MDVELPPRARAWLTSVVAPEADGIRAVRIRMRGEIRLKGRWHPFRARQWLDPHVGFEWRARVRMGVLLVTGFDRYRAGRGEVDWRMFGLLPVARDAGPDVDRAARGRLVAESIWVPSALFPERGVAWRDEGAGGLVARWTVDGSTEDVAFDLDPAGRLAAVRIARWGDPDGQGARLVPFGGRIEALGTFAGLTVPKRVSVGWFFGSERYEREGEFFRATILDLGRA